ncbi:MAG: potassium-transporting ATPase subunit KdpC [Magnetococcus sp. WYHC-3]
MIQELTIALRALLLFSLLTGVIYPGAVTLLAQTLMPYQANGSLLHSHGTLVGSELVGQSFHMPGYFHGRPSATALHPYNAAASGARNLGPLNPALAQAVRQELDSIRQANPRQPQPPPADLLTASASGLDPHISPAAARWQIPRVAQARNMTEAAVAALVVQETEGRMFHILGEPRVNVLRLNLALDRHEFGP